MNPPSKQETVSQPKVIESTTEKNISKRNFAYKAREMYHISNTFISINTLLEDAKTVSNPVVKYSIVTRMLKLAIDIGLRRVLYDCYDFDDRRLVDEDKQKLSELSEATVREVEAMSTNLTDLFNELNEWIVERKGDSSDDEE